MATQVPTAASKPVPKLVLKINPTGPSCSAHSGDNESHSGCMDLLLGRRTIKYYTKPAIHKWSEAASAPVKRTAKLNLTIKKKRYFIKFHKGTTLKLWYRNKLSTKRIPNRWSGRIEYS